MKVKIIFSCAVMTGLSMVVNIVKSMKKSEHVVDMVLNHMESLAHVGVGHVQKCCNRIIIITNAFYNVQMRNILLFVLVCIIWTGCVAPKSYVQYSTSDFIIEPDNVQPDLDISDILSDTFDVIKLETNDKCLIGEIGKVSFNDQYIFISDPNISQKLFMFDRVGNFIRNIGKQGNGPGEYAALGNFTILGDSLLIQDYYKDKYLVYQIKKGTFADDIHYTPNHHSVIAYQDVLYMISRYFPSNYGCYNLYRYDMRNKQMEPILPFLKEIATSQRAWSINQQSCRVGDHSFAFFPLNDTIYEINRRNIWPAYTLTFTKRNIPEDFIASHNGEEVMNYAFREGYVRGPIHLQHSDKWMLATYVDGKEYRYILLDKETKDYKIGRYMGLRKEGGLSIPGNYLMEDNYFITWLPANLLKMWGQILDTTKFTFSDEKKKEYWKKLIGTMTEEDNPVLIRCKIKKK